MIFVLHGKDAFRRQLRLNQLKAKYLDAGMEALNFAEFNNPDLMDFVAVVRTPGFGFGKKIILIKDFAYLEEKSEDNDVEQILETLTGLPDNIVLIFSSEKTTGTIKLIKNLKSKLKDSLSFEEFKPFNFWETGPAAKWLMEITPASGLDASCAEYLVEQVGSEDSSKLYSELNRLIALGKPITMELIREECRGRHDVFAYTRKLAEGDIKGANIELEKLIINKETHLGLLALMETSISKYLKLKLAQEARLSEPEQAALVGITPQRLYYQKKEASNMRSDHLKNLLDKILEVERDVKTGKRSLELGLRRLVNS